MKKEITLTLFCCGGAALNIAKTFYEPSSKNRKDPGFARIKTVFVDTSRSNLPKFVEEGFYQIKGTAENPVDGSGKVRGANYKAIFNEAPEILKQFPATDFNIVLHSGSGGSGSTLGPVLCSELLQQGKNVVVMMVGSTTCEQEIKNTINTIMSYQGISTKRELPVVAMYFENGRCTMAEVDALVRMNILVLAATCSGENLGLDSRDLHNFINYQNVSKYKPALTGLEIYDFTMEAILKPGTAFSSVVSLVREGEDPNPGMVVGYDSYGQLSEAASQAIMLPSPIFLHTVQGYFVDVVNGLKEKQAAAERMYQNPINELSIDSAQTDDGIVL